MLKKEIAVVLLLQYLGTVVASYAVTGKGMQEIPAVAQEISVSGSQLLDAEPPNTSEQPDPMYGARDFDLPFYRLYKGNLKYFAAGELNTPTGEGDVWGKEHDNVNQSACGIPDNAYYISKVAIHPYFLKFADLSRYCMQDVCISFWKEDGSSDMMLKVTDICSTDPNDPTHCATPADIKIDRTKAEIWDHVPNIHDPRISGHGFPDPVWWFFMKCWDDGLPQPAYSGNNWFSKPAIPNNLAWAQATAMQQYRNNQISYAKYQIPTYPNGGYNPVRDDTTSPAITDWVPGKEPSWEPIAGGVGWGKKPNPALKDAVEAVAPEKSTKKAAAAPTATTPAKKDNDHVTSSTKTHTSTTKEHTSTTTTDTCTDATTSTHESSTTHHHHSTSHHKSTDSTYKQKDYQPSTATSSAAAASTTFPSSAADSTVPSSSSAAPYVAPASPSFTPSSGGSTAAAVAAASTVTVSSIPALNTSACAAAVTITLTNTVTLTSMPPPPPATDSSSSSVPVLPGYESTTSTAAAGSVDTTYSTLSTNKSDSHSSSHITTAHTPVSTGNEYHAHSSPSTTEAHSTPETHSTKTTETSHEQTSTQQAESYQGTVSAKVAAVTKRCTPKKHLARHKRRVRMVDPES